MCKYKTLLERQTFRHFGFCGGLVNFDVKFEWAFESNACRVSCSDDEGSECYEGLSITCDPSDRGEILKVGWNYLCECEMLEGRIDHTESHSWIVESQDELYAVFFNKSKKRWYVDYTINRLQKLKSKSGNKYSVKKGTKQLDIENREELLDYVERLIDEYEKIIII